MSNQHPDAASPTHYGCPTSFGINNPRAVRQWLQAIGHKNARQVRGLTIVSTDDLTAADVGRVWKVKVELEKRMSWSGTYDDDLFEYAVRFV